MKRHQVVKVITWTSMGIFLASASALTFAAFFEHAMLIKAMGLILCNSVFMALIPIGFLGDDLDIPWSG